MMNELQTIEQKIAGLLHKKEQLRDKAAKALYTKLESLLGDNFCPQLVMGLVSEEWQNRDSALCKKWQERGSQFFRIPHSGRSAEKPATDLALQTAEEAMGEKDAPRSGEHKTRADTHPHSNRWYGS